MSRFQGPSAQTRSYNLILSIILAVGLLPMLVHGQTPTDSEPPTDTPQLKPTIVTARQWEEPLQTVPQAVSSFSDVDLEQSGATSVRDASLMVPNIHITEFTNRRLSFPFVRGVGSGQGDPGVVTYIDGVAQLTTNTASQPLIDVERIEFLRGPQSTLFGRNALGGCIQIITRRPTDIPEVRAAANVGNYGLQDYAVSYDGPITENLLFSVTGNYNTRDGYVTNLLDGSNVADRESTYGRTQFLFLPDDDLDIHLNLSGEKANDGGFAIGFLDDIQANPHTVNQDFNGQSERDIFAATLTVDHRSQSFDTTSITNVGYWATRATSDFDFSPLDGIRRLNDRSQNHASQEFRFTSPGDLPQTLTEDLAWRWLAGVLFFYADSDRAETNDFRPGGAGILFPPAQVGQDTSTGKFQDRGVAVYGQAAVTFDDQFDLTAGLRYDYEDKKAHIDKTFTTGGVTVPVATTQQADDFEQWSPKVSLAWRVNQDLMPYLSAARGFKAGGYNLAAPAGKLAFSPESSWTYEAGVKTSWLDRKLIFNAAAFYIDWDEMQLSLFDATSGGYVDNVGKSHSSGFELELQAKPTKELHLTTGFGYTRARFDQYTDPYGVDVQGNQLPTAPRTTFNLAMQYDRDLTEKLRLSARAEYINIGRFYHDAGNLESEQYDLLNFRLGVAQDNWRLEAWIKNALDQAYVPVAFQPSPADPSVFAGENGAPQTFGLAASIIF